MPRTSKFVHPLRVVREALKKSQPEFGKMFGVSGSYIQGIELGGRPLRDELADDIMLKLGVTAESLKRKSGLPTALLQKKRIAAMTDRETGAAIVSELRRLDGRPRERLHYQIDLWRKMLPALERSIRSQGIIHKFFLFLKAATHERKHLTVLHQFDRWMENAAKKFRLQSTIIKIAGGNYTEDWQPFREMILQSLPFLPPQKNSNKTVTRKVTLPPKREKKQRKR